MTKLEGRVYEIPKSLTVYKSSEQKNKDNVTPLDPKQASERATEGKAYHKIKTPTATISLI